jgi:hypothetical protein
VKVKIGPYKSYWGPYQIASFLKKVGVSEDKSHNIGEWLSKTWLQDVCQWIYDKRKRSIYVKIDNYDTWSADHTLSMIIHPVLLSLKEQKHGAPFVDDEDVPEEIRSHNAPPKEHEWDIDEFHFQRWEWVLGEMIYAHDPEWDDKYGLSILDLTNDVARAKYAEAEKRRQNGFRLFGKMYSALWT